MNILIRSYSGLDSSFWFTSFMSSDMNEVNQFIERNAAMHSVQYKGINVSEDTFTLWAGEYKQEVTDLLLEN